MNIYQYIERTASKQMLAHLQALVRGRQMQPLIPAVVKPSVVLAKAKQTIAEERQ